MAPPQTYVSLLLIDVSHAQICVSFTRENIANTSYEEQKGRLKTRLQNGARGERKQRANIVMRRENNNFVVNIGDMLNVKYHVLTLILYEFQTDYK
jgi:hypothetical protein